MGLGTARGGRRTCNAEFTGEFESHKIHKSKNALRGLHSLLMKLQTSSQLFVFDVYWLLGRIRAMQCSAKASSIYRDTSSNLVVAANHIKTKSRYEEFVNTFNSQLDNGRI